MATVFLATDLKHDREVALKRLELRGRETGLAKRFLREAEAACHRRGEVGEKVEAELVTQMQRGIHHAWRVDDERRLAVPLARLDQSGDAVEVQDATPRIS